MAIVRMKKVYIVTHKEARETMVSSLQELGLLQLSSFADDEPLKENFDQFSVSYQEMEETIAVLKHLAEFLKKRSGEKIPGTFLLEKEQWNHIVNHFNFEDCVFKGRHLEEALSKVEAKRGTLNSQLQQLEPWQCFPLRLGDIEDTSNISYIIGYLKHNKDIQLQDVLDKQSQYCYVQEIQRIKDTSYVVVITIPSEREKVLNLLKPLGFSNIPFPKIKATPRQLYKKLSREWERNEQKKEDILKECRHLAQNLPKLLSFIDYYENVREHKRVQSLFMQSRETMLFTGWIPARREQELKQQLEKRIGVVEMSSRDPLPEEDPPVEIENAKTIKPFEAVTELYGYPVYSGIDPTLYFAPFFALFFGICLGDAGYGIVLSSATLFILWKRSSRLTESSRKFLWLFFICGLFAIGAGVAMGSFFGVSTPFRLFDPLSQLSLFLGISFGLGLIHLFTGLVIKMRENIQAGGWLAGVWDQGAWMILIVSLITFGCTGLLGLPEIIKKLALFFVVVGAGFIVLFQARTEDKNSSKDIDAYQLSYFGVICGIGLWLAHILPVAGKIIAAGSGFLILFLGRKNIKGILARIGLGLYNLYSITGYLGDVLSYSRLVALGLGGGVIAMVVNTMAGITKDLIPVVGTAAAILVLIGGHAFNLAMSLLSAFVHTARLQYVEFFTKFYTSGGKKFRPFRWEFKNVLIVDKRK